MGRRTGELKTPGSLPGDVRVPPNPGREGLGTTGREVFEGDTNTAKVDFAVSSFGRVSADGTARRCGLGAGGLLGGCNSLGLDVAAPEAVAGRVFRKLRAGEGFKLSKNFECLAGFSLPLLSLSQLATSSFIWRSFIAKQSVSSPSPS